MKNLNSYLDRLTSMRMRPEVLQHAVDILKAVPQIQTELENPATSRMKREDIIQEIFPTESRQFIYGLVEDGALGSLDEILKAYIQNNCNTTQTSKELFLHRNTIINKIAKIEELIGCSINNWNVQLNLMLSLMVMDYTEKCRNRDLLNLTQKHLK